MAEIVTVNEIELGVEAADWEEAVRAAGAVMVREGIVTPEYVDAMVETVHTLGPYIVIAPGLAMPHAKAGDRVLRSGISIITLKTPVCFGNRTNDPAHMLVALAGKNDDIHLDILQAISDIFEDEQTVYKLAACEDKQTIADIFNGMEVNLE